MKLLKVESLGVAVEDKEIIRDMNFEMGKGEIHVIMGPNGSGKSTLALAIMGHPAYRITRGHICFEDKIIDSLPVDERARMGILMAFQAPEDIEGVRIIDYLTLLLEKVRGMKTLEAKELIFKKAREVWFSDDMLSRYINVGFSGGERKRFEILQALLLEPKLLILDEPDSGVDVDSLSLVSLKIRELYERGTSVMLITHYGRILEHIDPSTVKVHIIREGRIVMSGGEELVERIEKEGFKKVFEECGCNE